MFIGASLPLLCSVHYQYPTVYTVYRNRTVHLYITYLLVVPTFGRNWGTLTGFGDLVPRTTSSATIHNAPRELWPNLHSMLYALYPNDSRINHK